MTAASRVWAERFARLDPNHSPGDVPAKRWLGHFLDGPFCAVAASLTWGAFNVFGCDDG
jgi:hypothetical protein